MSARLLAESEYPTWDDWLRSVDGANVHQTSMFRPALDLYGYSSEILVTERNGRFTGGTQLAIRRVGPLMTPIAHVSGGLALASGAPVDHLRTLLGALLDHCHELRAARLELAVRIPLSIGDRAMAVGHDLARVLREEHFHRDGPIGTYFVDLATETDEHLLGSYGPNARRHIRKAVRESVETAATQNPDDFQAFEEAHYRMTSRKHLDHLPDGFCTGTLLPLVRAGHGHLLVARHRGVARNYVFIGSTGIPIYHWGAMTDEALEKGCPQTGQLLHHRAMCLSRSQHHPIYDFGGAEGPVPVPGHPNFGVWRLKNEFRGRYVRFVGNWHRNLRPLDSALLGLLRGGVRLTRRVRRTVTH